MNYKALVVVCIVAVVGVAVGNSMKSVHNSEVKKI